jgi:hypothetical protein
VQVEVQKAAIASQKGGVWKEVEWSNCCAQWWKTTLESALCG